MQPGLRATLLLAAPVLFLAVWFVRPVAAMLAQAWDVDAWRWVAGPYVQGHLRGALLQALLSTALSLALAVPLAWWHHRRALPWTRLQMAVHAAPFVLPVFVIVFGIEGVFGARGWIPLLPWLGPLGAVVLAHAYYNYGFAARLLHAALESRPRRLEEAARTLGASGRVAVWRVTVPLLLPAAGAVATLVFLFTFTSFGVVLLLGGREVETLETLLHANLSGAFPRMDRAAALAVLQLALNAALLLGYGVLHRRTVPLPREVPRLRSPGPGARALSWLWAALAATPVVAVLGGAFWVRGRWTLEAWRALVDVAHPAHLHGFDLGHAVQVTLGYAAASAAAALALTAGLAYGLRPLGTWGRRVVEAAAALPLATSSLVIGFGYLVAFGVAGFVHTWQGRVLVVAAHTLVAFPFTARAMLPAIGQHDARLDEAARTLGAPPWAVVGRIHLGLLRAPVAAAAGLAVAMSLGDFGASLLLMNAENRSVSVWIAAHAGARSFDPMMHAQADALAVVLLALTVAAYVVVERVRGVEWS